MANMQARRMAAAEQRGQMKLNFNKSPAMATQKQIPAPKPAAERRMEELGGMHADFAGITELYLQVEPLIKK